MKISFTSRIYLYFISGVIIASFFSILIIYNDYSNYINTGIEENMIRGAIGAENIINSEEHAALIGNPEKRNSRYYIETLEKLFSLSEISNFSYVYTLVKFPDNKFHFIFDTEDYQVHPGDRLSFLREYENMPGEILDAYNSRIITVTRDYYTDEWGTFKSAFLPVMDSHKNIEYIIGVDYDASFIVSLKQKIFYISIFAFAATLPFVILLVLMLKKDVIKHVNRLSEEIVFGERENIKLKNYLSNIIESMPSILITIDENSIVTQWNQAAVIATGISAADALGRNILDVSPMFGDYLNNSIEVMKNRKTVEYYRRRLREDDEQLKNITLFPLVANCVKGIVFRVDDITELERKDQQLRQMQKMEIVGNLAGGIAHDFNNMLGGIMGALSIVQLKRKNGTLSENMLGEYLTMMEESGIRAADMAKQLMLLSRSNETSLHPVDLNSIIMHVRKICQNTFDKSVLIEMEAADEPVIINADITQIEQVILNLCVNASHAMTIMREENETTGGKLSVTIEEIHVDSFFIETHPEADNTDSWKISVRDTGVGMEAKTIAKIFEPFFTTKTEGKGTGLGLSVVYSIIKSHKGFIDVYSEKGWGSEFSVYLPVFRGDAVISSGIGKCIKGEGVILVIDDEEVICKITKGILEECGYTVIVVQNGDDGIELYRKNIDIINLVLIDVVMPQKNGIETSKEIRAINPEIRIILTSGFKKDERIEKLFKTEINGFVQKPYTVENLSKAVYDVLNETAV